MIEFAPPRQLRRYVASCLTRSGSGDDIKLLRPTETPGDYFGPNAAFSNGHLTVNYQYATEDLCATPEPLSKESSYRVSTLNVAGKLAKVQTWSRDRRWSFITLCFSDIGDGKTRLHFGASSKAQNEIDVARQIFASLQFR